MGFRLNLNWGFPSQSHFKPNRLPSSTSTSSRSKEPSHDTGRLSFLSNTTEEYGSTVHRSPIRSCTCLSASFGSAVLEHDFLDWEITKMTIAKSPDGILTNSINDPRSSSDVNKADTSSSSFKISHFRLLMENLNALEGALTDSYVSSLERNILMQLGKLGALNLFHTCLSRAVQPLGASDLSVVPPEYMGDNGISRKKDDHVKQTASPKKFNIRKSKRKRKSKKADRNFTHSIPSTAYRKLFQQSAALSPMQASNTKKRRLMIAKNEAEMSKGIKVIAELERVRMVLEEEMGQVATLSCWAEAAGVDEKVLQQNLQYGWFCRDEILRSARSLVLFLARNYRGLGVALEDLIQAGNMGVLHGAERFDHTRGYRFSTYVQYWIRKSMSRMVAQHARGVRVPYTLCTAINRIEKARKMFHYQHGKSPNDEEIAKITGLTVAKVRSASKCLRVVGSIDQKIGGGLNAKYMEFTPDFSIKSPEEIVLSQHKRNEIYKILNSLDTRERQVIMLRYGLKDHQPKSLEQIGRIFDVSKEWIRKIERKAMKKLQDQEVCTNLSHYLGS